MISSDSDSAPYRFTPSPVTGVLDESRVILDFSKHQGRSVQEVQNLDPDFYESLVENKRTGIYAIKREAHLDGEKTYRLYLNPLAQFDQ